jgi:ABC-type multidrug transport system fused ATPase/permease subunit
MQKIKKIKLIRNSRLLKFILFYKKQIFLLFIFNLISSSFLLVAPYFSKLFFDQAFANRDMHQFLNISLAGGVIFVLSTLVTVGSDIIKNKTSVKLNLNLADKFIRKLYLLELNFFQLRSVGENIYRLSDTENISRFLVDECPRILSDLFKLVIILAIAFWINLEMTVLLIILSPLFLIHRLYLQRKLKSIYENIWKFSALIYKELYEAFSRILIIKAFGLESHQRRAYLRTLLKNIRLRLRSFRWGIISSLSSSFLSKAVFGVITLYGGWLIIKGRLTLGSYTAVMLYLTQLGGILESLGFRFEYFSQETVSLEKFFEIIELEPQIRDLPGARNLEIFKGEVRFRDVWFGYREDKPVLKGINLYIPTCSWVGIVGPSGCGKTTLVNLILRLYDPWQGEIILDTLDLRQIKLNSLREKIAIAAQQPLLFDRSIKENIGYGLKGIPQERIESAARLAFVHDFILQLPQGYNTLIGEDACRLSEGMKQRISIARAIIRNPQLLILDEATSSVDLLTEEKIFNHLRKTRKEKTTIVISHRLFSVKDADKIYFLRQDGKIEEGRHEELLSISALYRDFFQNQEDELL